LGRPAVSAHLAQSTPSARSDRGSDRPLAVPSPPRVLCSTPGSPLTPPPADSGESRPPRLPPAASRRWPSTDLLRHATSSAQRPPCSLRRPLLRLGFRPAAAALRRSSCATPTDQQRVLVWLGAGGAVAPLVPPLPPTRRRCYYYCELTTLSPSGSVRCLMLVTGLCW
jgi:hypothetical protein